jgi:hypothetical protein
MLHVPPTSLLDLIILIILDEEYEWWSSSLCNVLHSTISLCLPSKCSPEQNVSETSTNQCELRFHRHCCCIQLNTLYTILDDRNISRPICHYHAISYLFYAWLLLAKQHWTMFTYFGSIDVTRNWMKRADCNVWVDSCYILTQFVSTLSIKKLSL